MRGAEYVTIAAVRSLEMLLDRASGRLGPARLASTAAVLVAAMLLAGLLVAVLASGVHPEAWGAAAGLAALVAAGLVYAWRLGAYGPPD